MRLSVSPVVSVLSRITAPFVCAAAYISSAFALFFITPLNKTVPELISGSHLYDFSAAESNCKALCSYFGEYLCAPGVACFITGPTV